MEINSNTRYFTEEDYPMLLEWWKFWRFPAPGLINLPKTGVIVNINEKDICSGFVYLTNSNMCWIEFIVSNPDEKDKEVRKIAISECINQLCYIAKEMGYQVAYTSLKNESLQNKYLEEGFILGSKGCNEYIKLL
jgi:hypothetical protein